MKILIPMAGEGSRFAKEGYTLPKPLIDVNGKPMIRRVIENLNFDAEYIFLVRKKHIDTHQELLNMLADATNNNSIIVTVDSLTSGAACTALLAEQYINTSDDLLIANSDQIISYEKRNFLTMKRHCLCDSIVFCFNAIHPKWSFVNLSATGLVDNVVEKVPISDIATCGIYWYKHGSDFVKYAKTMISKGIKTNNEFYIAPVYNELIGDGKRLLPYFVDEMHGIGTPDDLNLYLAKIK